MQIRNDHTEPRLVPAQHLIVAPGETAPWPDDQPIPDGFTAVRAKAAKKTPDVPTPDPEPEPEESATDQEQ